MKIVYSEFDSDAVTKMMDDILDYRDTLCKELILKGASAGQIRTKQGRKLARFAMRCCTAVSWIAAVFGTVLTGCLFGPLAVLFVGLSLMFSLYGLYLLFDVRFAPEEMPLSWLYTYQTLKEMFLGDPRDNKEEQKRADHVQYQVYDERDPENLKHISDTVEYFGPNKCKIQKRLSDGDVSIELESINKLLGAANRLSKMRCLAEASNKIEDFMENYGRENVDVSISVKQMGENKGEDDGMYVITLKEKAEQETGTVIPTEQAVLEIHIPYAIGKKMIVQHKDKKKQKTDTTLNLAVFDSEYKYVKELCSMYRAKIKKDWKDKGKSEMSPVFQKLLQLDQQENAKRRKLKTEKQQVRGDEDLQNLENDTMFEFPEFPQEIGADETGNTDETIKYRQ